MQEAVTPTKKDNNKVYLLVAIIAALIAVNGYLYFKHKQRDTQQVSVSNEKDRLSLEIEKIEVELDKVGSLNVTLNDRLQDEQKLARTKIGELKAILNKGEITKGELDNTKEQIGNLRTFVKNYNDQVIVLEKENSYLKSERDSLKTTVNVYTAKSNNLERENRNLNEKVKIGAALKAADIRIEALRVKDNGKAYPTTRAGSANKLKVNFSIVSNILAEKGYHKVFLRVFDPTGNLIAEDYNLFSVRGQQMQYSNLIEFVYNNDNTTYSIDWVNPKSFVEGTYSLMLYADGFVMGKSEIKLD